jgi:tetratricopeptide (TPR) repeat protein
VDAAVAERNRRVRVRPIEDLRIGPRLPIEDFARAREAIEAGDHQIALDAARRSLANAPELVAAHGVVGRALVAMGQKTQAAQAYETAIEVCVYNPTLLARAAVALHAAGRASAAAELQSKVAAAAPEGGQASVNEVITLWSAARFQEAISVADALVQRGQDPVPVRLIRGLARFELNDAKGALQDLDAHLALAEGDTAARNIRADLLTALKRPDEAKAAYEDVLGRLDAQLATDPQQAGVRGRRAYTLLALGRANEALIEARHAAELDPDDALARRSIGRAHLVRDEIEEAVTALEAGREREPERIEILYDLARALARLDRTDEARPYLNQAIDRSPRLAYTAQRDRHLAPLLDDED